MALTFDYWNRVNPATFLADDWDNPVRAWAGEQVAAAVKRGCKTMVEVGPGPGVDYERQFRRLVADGTLRYAGYEPSITLCASLAQRFPEAAWAQFPLLCMPAGVADLVYCKAVLEHQPDLEPSFSHLMRAARRVVVLVWYRPPGDEAIRQPSGGVHYNTYRRKDALAAIAAAGWQLMEEALFASGPCGNLGWIIEPKREP